MTTTLDNEYDRAHDPEFLKRVASALYRMLPDVMHEAVGGSAGAHAKRHACAVACLQSPGEWVPRAAALLAGENSIRAVDLPAQPADAVIIARLTAIFSDLAGVAVTD